MEGTISLGSAIRGLHGLPTATGCAGRETGPRGPTASETMKCPQCHTPMEEGLLDKSCFFQRREPERARQINSWVFSFFNLCRVRRVTAHRCPACTRIELTAP